MTYKLYDIINCELSHIFILYNEIMFQCISMDRIKSHRLIFKRELCASQHSMTVNNMDYILQSTYFII